MGWNINALKQFIEGGSRGLVVKGGDSNLEGHEFESKCQILEWHFHISRFKQLQKFKCFLSKKLSALQIRLLHKENLNEALENF